MTIDDSVRDLETSGRAFATFADRSAADAWCQAARRIARSMRRPSRTWGYSLGAVWYVNAVIEDWPATAAERRALREWEIRHDDEVGAQGVQPDSGSPS